MGEGSLSHNGTEVSHEVFFQIGGLLISPYYARKYSPVLCFPYDTAVCLLIYYGKLAFNSIPLHKPFTKTILGTKLISTLSFLVQQIMYRLRGYG